MRKDKQLYRCNYTPLTIDKYPVASESGVQPHVEVLACNAEEAMQLAHKQTGCPVETPVRIEGPRPRARRRASTRRPRPVIRLVTGAAMLAALTLTACGHLAVAGLHRPGPLNCSERPEACK